MSSLRLALKLSMVEVPAGISKSSDDIDDSFNSQTVHKRKRKLSTGDDVNSSGASGKYRCINMNT